MMISFIKEEKLKTNQTVCENIIKIRNFLLI